MGRIATNFRPIGMEFGPNGTMLSQAEFHRNISWNGVAPIARRRNSLGTRDAITEKSAFRILRKVLQVRFCVPTRQCDRSRFLGDRRPIGGVIDKRHM
jgi:hypothetical protein